MKIARVNSVRPVQTISELFGTSTPGPSGQVLTSTGSNSSSVAWGSNVAVITSNGSNVLVGPYVGLQSGTGIAFAASSNILTISSTVTGGGSGTSTAFAGAKAYATATQSVSDSTETVIVFGSEEYDTDGFHSTVTNTGRFTVPTGKGGYYNIQAGGNVANTTGNPELRLRLNGTTYIRGGSMGPTGLGAFVLNISAEILLADGDYVELIGYQTSGASQTWGHATLREQQFAMSVTAQTTSSGSGASFSVVDAKGDLIVGTANDTVDRLGAPFFDGSVLVRATSSTTGLSWESHNQTGSDPTTTDDSSGGWSVGSRWINTSTDEEFVLTDATPSAAVWQSTTSTGSSASDPIEDAFGTPDTAFEFNANDFTGLTAMGTADVESMHGTVAGHLLIADDDSTQVGRYAAVSTPCTGIVKVTDFVAYENFQYVGMMFGVGTPGNIETLSLLGGASPSLVVKTWVPFTTGSPGAVTITRVPTDSVGFTPWYLGVRIASSTDISWYCSRSGIVWQPLVLNRNPGITIASLGVSLGNYAGGSQPRAAGCYDYIRIWNSAKTFPAFS